MPAAKAQRVFWREILPGDRLKIAAASNTSPTGGGARDLRFPDGTFRATLRKMFPEDAVGRGHRAIRRGVLVWDDADGEHSRAVDYWPATKARPWEGRIARLNELPPLQNPPEIEEGDRLVLLIVQDDTGSLRAYYATASSLRSRAWHRAIADPILDCLERENPRRTPQGALDLTTGTSTCYG